jgi:hypothetical protein
VRVAYLTVLRTRHARPVLAAALLGRLSYAMGPLALVLVVQRATGSFAWAGAATAATLLTSGLLAPVRGRLVDRYGHRRCLPPMAMAYAAALAGVVVVARPDPAGALAAIVLAGLAGAAAPPLGAAMRVLWTTLVGHGPALQTAYALDTVLEEATYTIGPLLAGALAAAVIPAVGLLVAAGLGVVGTLAFVASPVSRAWTGRLAGTVGWAGAMAGAGMRTLVASLAGVGAAVGIWDIGLVAAARSHGSAAAGGLLLAALAAGSALGGLWYGGRQWRPPASHRYLALAALLVLACAPMPAAPSLLALGLLVGVVGLLLAPLTSTAYLLAAELAPRGTITEAATWVTTANNVTGAAGLAGAGALVDRVGVAWTLAVAWACAATALLVALAGRTSLDHPPPQQTPVPP